MNPGTAKPVEIVRMERTTSSSILVNPATNLAGLPAIAVADKPRVLFMAIPSAS
jgi:hypothetical protein